MMLILLLPLPATGTQDKGTRPASGCYQVQELGTGTRTSESNPVFYFVGSSPLEPCNTWPRAPLQCDPVIESFVLRRLTALQRSQTVGVGSNERQVHIWMEIWEIRGCQDSLLQGNTDWGGSLAWFLPPAPLGSLQCVVSRMETSYLDSLPQVLPPLYLWQSTINL